MNDLQNSGIQLFKKGNKYLFSILDEAGAETLATSKAFGSAASRDKGIDYFWDHLLQLELLEQNDQTQFVLKATNGQILLRSRPFPTAAECEQGMTFVQSSFAAANASAGTAPAVKGNAPALKRDQPSAPADDLPPKYSFRIAFYSPHAGGALSGKIEYPFQKEKQAFSGLNMLAVEAFIRKYLPEETIAPGEGSSQAATVAPAILPPGNKAKSSTLRPSSADREPPAVGSLAVASAPVSIPVGNIIEFELIDRQTGATLRQLSLRQPTDLRFDITGLPLVSLYSEIQITVYTTALATADRQKVRIGSGQWQLTKPRAMKVPLNLSLSPSAGTQRIGLLLRLSAGDGAVAPLYLSGSKMSSLQP